MMAKHFSSLSLSQPSVLGTYKVKNKSQTKVPKWMKEHLKDPLKHPVHEAPLTR